MSLGMVQVIIIYTHGAYNYIYALFIINKHAQVVTDQQTSCNKVVVKPISGCVRTACSQLL